MSTKQAHKKGIADRLRGCSLPELVAEAKRIERKYGHSEAVAYAAGCWILKKSK